MKKSGKVLRGQGELREQCGKVIVEKIGQPVVKFIKQLHLKEMTVLNDFWISIRLRWFKLTDTHSTKVLMSFSEAERWPLASPLTKDDRDGNQINFLSW